MQPDSGRQSGKKIVDCIRKSDFTVNVSLSRTFTYYVMIVFQNECIQFLFDSVHEITDIEDSINVSFFELVVVCKAKAKHIQSNQYPLECTILKESA